MKQPRKKIRNMDLKEFIRHVGIVDIDVINQLTLMDSFKSPSDFNKSGEVYLLVGYDMCKKLRRYWPDCVGYTPLKG